MTNENKKYLMECASLYHKELREDVMPFWMKNGVDRVNGGIYTCLDRKGKVFSTDKSVWMQGRCGWTYAYLCKVYGVLVELGLEIFEFNPLLPPKALEGRLVVVLCIKKCDSHRFSPCLW